MHDTVILSSIEYRGSLDLNNPTNPGRLIKRTQAPQEQCLPWRLLLLYPWSLQAGLVNTATHMLEEHRKNQMQGSGLSINSRYEDTLDQLLPGQ